MNEFSIEVVTKENEIKDLLVSFAPFFHDQSKNNEDVINSLSHKFFMYGCVVEAKEDGIPIGYCAYYANDQVKKCAFLSMIIVVPQAQGRRVGHMLVDYMINDCRSKNMSAIKLEVANDNSRAICFYENLGFYKSEILSETSSQFTMNI